MLSAQCRASARGILSKGALASVDALTDYRKKEQNSAPSVRNPL